MARKWVKYALLISILLCSVVAFFGCGGQKQAKTQGDIVEVRFGYPGGVGDYEALKNTIIPMFEEANPQIKINLEYQPWSQFFTKLKTQIAANEAPDFWVSDGVYVMEFADRGALKDLTDWIERDFNKDDFLALDFAKDPEGRIWGIPREIQTIALYYNKTDFKERGVAYPDETWDWDLLLEASKKLTQDKNGNGKIDTYGFYSQNWLTAGWYNFIYQNQGEVLDRTRTKSRLNSKESIEAVEFMVDMIYKHKVAPTSDDTSGVEGGAFESNVVAMLINNYANTQNYNTVKSLDYDVAVLPKGKVRAAGYNANPFVINSKAKLEKAEAAWEFIKFFASNKEVQRLWTKSGFGVPILKEVIYSNAFVEAKGSPANKKAFIEPLENGYATSMDLNKCWNEWRVSLTENLTLAWLGQVSAKDAVLKAHRDVQRILDRAYNK
mgnify:CR=1 FL=1